MIENGLLFTEVSLEYETRVKVVIAIGESQRLIVFMHTKRNSHGQRVHTKFTVIYSDKLMNGQVCQPLLPRMVLDFEDGVFPIYSTGWGSNFLSNILDEIGTVILEAIGGESGSLLEHRGVKMSSLTLTHRLKPPISAYTLQAMSPRITSFVKVEKDRVVLGCGFSVDSTTPDTHKHGCILCHYQARMKDESFAGTRCKYCRHVYPKPEMTYRCEKLCEYLAPDLEPTKVP